MYAFNEIALFILLVVFVVIGFFNPNNDFNKKVHRNRKEFLDLKKKHRLRTF